MIGLLATACRYPLATRAARDGLAAAWGLVLTTLVLVRVSRAVGPTLLALGPLALAAVPAVLFAGQVGATLRTSAAGAPEPPRIAWSAPPVRTGAAVVVVAVAYLVGPTAVLLGTVVTLREAAAAGGAGGRAGVAVLGTTALLVALGLAYALPAGLAVAARDGVRAGLRAWALPGLRSGAYFAAWAGASVLVVLAWGGLAATGPGSPAAVLAAATFAYAHLAAARLAGEGLARAAGRSR